MNELYVQGITVMLSESGGDTAAADPISKFFQIIWEMIAPIQQQTGLIATIGLLIAGLIFMAPVPKKYKSVATTIIIFLIIGSIIILGAGQYGNYISTKAQF